MTARLAYIALTISLAANGLLAWTNHQWSVKYEDLRDEEELTPSVQLPPIVGTDRSGQRINTEFEGERRRTLMVVFTPTCPYCAQNWPNWSRLIASATPEFNRVVAVDLSGDADDEYVRLHGLSDVQLYKSLDYRVGARYKLRAVPTTLLISPSGVLERVWKGVLSDQDIAELQSRLQSPPRVEDTKSMSLNRAQTVGR